MITIKATGDTTLRTAGKYCPEDILIKVPEGTELPELSNEGIAADLLSGKQLIDGEGNKVTGTFSIDSELNEQDSLIEQIIAAADSLPEAGGGSGSDDSFPYTIKVNNNMGFTYSIAYDTGNAEAIIIMPGTLGVGQYEIIGGAMVKDRATSSDFVYYYITSITSNVILNVTFDNPFA